MKSAILRSDSLLMLTSLIWGFAFVAQRAGMEYVGPFIFNGIRFALGAMVIIPVIWLSRKHKLPPAADRRRESRYLLRGGLLLGLVLFGGATFQQYGMVYTTAGNAGFITGLYVVFVPLLGMLRRQYPHFTIWIAAMLAVAGMIFAGDLLVLAGALFWAVHLLIIGVLSPRVNSLKLAFIQYVVCAVLSTVTAVFTETISTESILNASIPILYGGVLSVGIAYTLQVVAQKKAPPAHAAIILSLEAVFAVIGGWMLLHESLGTRELAGCALMFAGILLAQYCSLSKGKCGGSET